ncbi:Flp family type IVb pilin [Photobacterium sp.]|uniref:Flp family type IVb pilin n=1 Tax=Photobacterium sp. TaxID=660 RepID=UPI00299CD88D|nr:Flp family type IVb pilin [Photobacterium sp.]MDX1302213.1 Flp family type IVb pilin [Photobacterium sp.]
MNNLKQYLIEFCRDEEGLTTVEYAIAGALVAVGVVTAFSLLGDAVENTINDLTDAASGTVTP